MLQEKRIVYICQIAVNCPGIRTYQGVKIIPGVKNPKRLIIAELTKIFKAEGFEVTDKAFNIEIEVIEEKTIFPLFELVRHCPRCDTDARKLGIGNDRFVYCGSCGKPTDFILTSPSEEPP